MTTGHLQVIHSAEGHGYFLVILFMATMVSSSTQCPTQCNCRQESGHGTIVDCRRRELTSVVSDLPSDAVELDLGDNPITTLTRTDFPSTWKLKRLRLNGCRLERLERATFRNLQLLEILDLSRNSIQQVDDGAFQGLSHLKTLNLDENRIRSLPGYLFRGLTLNELRLATNSIEQISEDLFGAAKIRNLNLDRNEIANLRRAFLLPLEGSLSSFSISGNSRALDISHDTFSGTNLSSLHITSSMLRNAEFLSWTTMVSIIDLSGNSLSSSQIPVNRNPTRTCKELKLRNVGLENLDSTLLSAFPGLINLDLSGNRLMTFRPEVFQHTQNLRVLDLSRNLLKRLPEGFGLQLYAVEQLNLSSNGLESLNWGLIGSMQRLENLDLSRNRLQVIPENSSSVVDSLDNLNLSDNPWYCNCEMRWFREWLAEQMRQVGSLRCANPFEGLMLNRVPDDFVCTSPRIVSITQSQNVREGINIKLSCAAQSDPAPAIVWRAPFGDVLSITPPEDRTRTKTIADWSIHRIKPYQSGWYSCNSTNLKQSNITYTYLQVIISPEDAVDFRNLRYPAIPTRMIHSSDAATSSLDWSTLGFRNETTRPHDGEGVDVVDGYWTPQDTEGDETSPTGRSTLSPDIAAQDMEAASASTGLIVTAVAVVVGVIMLAIVVVVIIVVIYRRRRHRKYPVKRRATEDGESAKLQMSNLDESAYNSTAGDPLNSSKNQMH